MPLLLLAFLVSWNVFAEVKLTVTASQFKKAKIAIGKVHSLSNNVPNEALAHKIREQVVEDLSFLNIFEPIPENIFSNYDTGGDNFVIKYEEWVQTQAAFYLRMLYRVEAGKIILEAHLYDIPGLKKVLGNRYQYSANNIPRLVHALSEDISKELTGERGLFFSRVLMTCRDLKSRKEKAPREIYICDSDGKSCANLTQDKTLSVSPSWGSDGNQVVYTQYEWVYGHNKKRKGHVIKVHQLLTGDRIKISSKEGINSGAAWSPDMKRIAATLSFAGRPEIYFLNPVNPEENPVPFSRFIKYRKLSGDGFMITPPSLLFDVEPKWSPDGQKIVFSSARTGSPMIYVVDVNTNIANQLTIAGVYNSSPAWSPKGDKILFSGQKGSQDDFDIFIIDPDGNNLKRVPTDEPVYRKKVSTENPTWAPTGRHLAFASNESGHFAIYSMTLEGNVKKRISPEGKECFTPAWGPKEN